MSNLTQPFKSEALLFNQSFDVLNKDLVITIDYSASYTSTPTAGTGFVLGFLPYYHPTPDGYSAMDGLGYASVSSLSYLNSSLSATGIQDAQVGIGFDFTGLFSLSGNAGSGGLSATNPNSICIRGTAPTYNFIAATNNLSTYPVPFSLYDTPSAFPSTVKSARVRITDFGGTVIVDLKNSPTSNYQNYLYTKLPSPIVPYENFYIGYTGLSGLSSYAFRIYNVNVNGYNTTINYNVSSAFYIGLSAVAGYQYPNPGVTLNKGDTIAFVNDISTSWTSYSSFSGLGTLILSANDSGMPYVANDGYVLIQYSI